MENYWHYVTDACDTNMPPFTKHICDPNLNEERWATSTLVIGTSDHTVYLGYCMKKDTYYTWYDLHGERIENVNRWNFLPQDSPIDDLYN